MSPVRSNESSASSSCPVAQDGAVTDKNPLNNMSERPRSNESAASSCPVAQDTANIDINPLNNMPANLSNTPGQNQSTVLPTLKTKSSIKKTTDKSGVWEYPSPQQFYNALKRKGWNTREDDIETMVNIHNFLNEECWKEVLHWEEKYHCDCKTDRSLLKFKGRPKEPTPKARFLNLFGVERPFDRHDWTIDRCGTEVRYVIDYYGGPDQGADPVFYSDVRPALDSPVAFYDRARDAFSGFTTWLTTPSPPEKPSPAK